MSVQSNKSQEPSMEEVLASIRRIISEEMENMSRSDNTQSDAQHFEFPWSQSSTQASSSASKPKMPQVGAVGALSPQPEAVTRHPFMPAPKSVAVEPVANEQPAPVSADIQKTLNNTDFLSSYFAEIPQKKAVSGVSDPVAKAPFAGIIPQKRQDIPTTIPAVAETAPKEPVNLSPFQKAPAFFEPVVPPQPSPALSPNHVADTMMAAFIKANLLPTSPVDSPAINQQPVSAAVSKPFVPETPAVTDARQPFAVNREQDLNREIRGEPSKPVLSAAGNTDQTPLQGLISDRTADVFSASLSSLANDVKTDKSGRVYPRLDEFVAELMKPLVSDWINQHLERIVERAVRDEIKRVSKMARS